MTPAELAYIVELEEQIKQQAAVIEQMREAVEKIGEVAAPYRDGMKFNYIADLTQEALAIQPCSEVLNKVRADAVRKAFKLMMGGRWRGDALDVLADRMEQGKA